jgi:hypothetical protein
LVFPIFPQNKGEMGATSPVKLKVPVDDGQNSSTSPVQTVTGKDFSNPLMAVALPKSLSHGFRVGESSRRQFVDVEDSLLMTCLCLGKLL